MRFWIILFITNIIPIMAYPKGKQKSAKFWKNIFIETALDVECPEMSVIYFNKIPQDQTTEGERRLAIVRALSLPQRAKGVRRLKRNYSF